jgi:hypothetical protein
VAAQPSPEIPLAAWSRDGVRRWLQGAIGLLMLFLGAIIFCLVQIGMVVTQGGDASFSGLGLELFVLVVATPCFYAVGRGVWRASKGKPAVWVRHDRLIIFTPIFFSAPVSKITGARLEDTRDGPMLTLDRTVGASFKAPTLPLDDPEGAARRIREFLSAARKDG